MRKFLRLLAALPVLFCILILPASGQDSGKADETELGRTMGEINRAWRRIKRQAPDPAQNPSTLQLLATMQAAVEKSAGLAPDLARDVPAGEREQFISDYRARMKELASALNRVEAALQASDNPAAVKVIEEIGALQKEGHRKFKRPEN